MTSFNSPEFASLGPFSRREFIRRSAIAASLGVAAPWALDLTGISAAAADTAPDYRALVCIFLAGGNDHWNTFVPNDPTGHAAYRDARDGVHRDVSELLSIAPVGGFDGPGSFGFAPELAGMHGMFESGRAAVVANIGTLTKPVTKIEAQSITNVPPQLRSHNDQQSMWQASAPEGATTGWGGKIADLVLDSNGSSSAFTSISVRGRAVMMTGDRALQYRVSSSGVTELRRDILRGDVADDKLRQAMSLAANGVFPSAIMDTSRRGLTAADEIAGALAAADATYDFASAFDSVNGSGLKPQLHMVARLMAAGRDHLGLRRQVFFVGTGGYDNHNDLGSAHPGLLRYLDESITSFHSAADLMGARDQVTSFTSSDFSRTLSTNGDGSDHGWGGHQIVVGGAVRGNRVVGTLPTTALDGPDSFGRGDLVPTTSVDQYAATFARWMGAGASELDAVVPNIGRFATSDLQLFESETEPDDPTPTDGPTISEPATQEDLRPARRLSLHD